MDRGGVAISMRGLFRAIGLYFVLRKQAMHESRSRPSSIKPRAAAAE